MSDAAIVITTIGAFGVVLFVVGARLSEALVRFRAHRLPSAIALRMEEEWLGELNAIASRPGKLVFAIALILTRRRAFIAPGEDSMTETIKDSRLGPLSVLSGRKALLILSTLIFAIAAYGTSFLLPRRYASESLILVKPREVPASFVVDLIAGSVEERLKSIEQTVMSRTNLVAIIREFGDQLPELRQLNMDGKVEKLRGQITIAFTTDSIVNGVKSITYFRISYVNQNPVLAQKIASKLTILFIEKDGATRESQVAGTKDFLSRELDKLAERLTEKGNELVRERAAHGPESARMLALDYELLVSSYRALFTKLQDAELTAALESDQKGGQFQVVDPANLPTTPFSPNRRAIAGVGAIAGFALGGMTIVSLDRRRRRALA